MASFRIRPARPTASMLISMIGICLVAFVATGCDSPNRQKAADDINDQIKRMPGVAHTDMSYHPADIDHGEYFGYDATLRDTATPRQVQDIGHAFISFVQHHSLNQAEGGLTFHLARPGPQPSTAEFGLPFKDSTRAHAEIDTNVAGWLRTARSPITVGASLNDPESSQISPRRSITAFVGPGATHDAMERLQHSDPALVGASWILAIPTKDQAPGGTEAHRFTWTAHTPQDNEIAHGTR